MPVRISVPAPALLSVPVPEILAATLSVSVKLATIWPSLTIAGVTIAPERPPLPRLSVLPAKMSVEPGELTTAPSATVSVPTRGPPQPQLGPPIVREFETFKTEPGPVTVTNEVPVMPSPTAMRPFTFTAPPLAIVSVPGPLVVPPPTSRVRPKPGSPIFQVEPGPVTVTLG